MREAAGKPCGKIRGLLVICNCTRWVTKLHINWSALLVSSHTFGSKQKLCLVFNSKRWNKLNNDKKLHHLLLCAHPCNRNHLPIYILYITQDSSVESSGYRLADTSGYESLLYFCIIEPLWLLFRPSSDTSPRGRFSSP